MEPAKEVRIVGNISHDFVEEKDPSVSSMEREEPSASTDGSKKPTKNYVIVPIKDQKSKITFIKIPIFKLSKAPKAEKAGTVSCRQVGPGEEGSEELEVQKWCADKIEINLPRKSKEVQKTDKKPIEVQKTDYKTYYAAHHVYPLEPEPEPVRTPAVEDSDPYLHRDDSRKSCKEQKKKKEKKESKKDSRKETKESFAKRDSTPGQASEKEIIRDKQNTNKTPQEESRKRWAASMSEGPSTPPKVLSYLVTSKEKQLKKKFL